MENLTKKDLEVLIEALGSWVKIKGTNKMMTDLLFAIMLPKDEIKEKLKEPLPEIEDKYRDEVATMLKAKLLIMKENLNDS